MGLAGYPTIPEKIFKNPTRQSERLEQVLANIENLLHVAFAALKKRASSKDFTMVTRFG